jgi:hypothetical protein
MRREEMSKKIFIGSSSEALTKARQLAEILSRMPDIECDVWDKIFLPSHLNFEAIEMESQRATGAILLATPDDCATIRGKCVQVPRANVMLELGYFSARLGRPRIALCRYDDVTLATDLAGFTYIGMGEYSPETGICPEAVEHLMRWIGLLPEVAEGVPSTEVLHGYSGIWSVRLSFPKWRSIDIFPTDFVQFTGRLDLHIAQDGLSGHGCVHGELSVQLKACTAQFKVTDQVINVVCPSDGTMKFDSVMHNRQQVRIYGTPPQDDGFMDEVAGPYLYSWTLQPSKTEPRTMEGEYVAHAGEYIRSRAKVLARKL